MAKITNPFTSVSRGEQGKCNVGAVLPMLAVLFVLCNSIFWIPNLQIARETRFSTPVGDNPVYPSFRKKVHSHKTQFIEETENMQIYTAAWWQSVERFVGCPIDEIKSLKDATIVPVRRSGNGQDDCHMTVDYLDFMVEHLSGWYQWSESNEGLAYATGRMQLATEQMVQKRHKQSTIFMQTTLAVIPLAANSKNPAQLRTLQEAMATTITSLLQKGIGRVVIVGHFENDAILARNAFLQLQMLYEQTESVAEQIYDSTLPFQVELKRQVDNETIVQQLAFVHTKGDGNLVPKAALKGLQLALKGKVDDNGQVPELWLGPKSPTKQQFMSGIRHPWTSWNWEYIYFTEPDQVLNARLTPSFTKAMDRDGIILPHRLQPIPHVSDLVGLVELQPAPVYKFIVTMDPEVDACCDLGPKSNTGFVAAKKEGCTDYWWKCFYEDGAEHMQQYDLIRATTGVVHVAADGHARQCRPIKGGRGTCVDVTDV
ncbi:hypothetical protein IV203_013722 [Nitzschia inconspicua]|uniref:Uncharacterized protein n=1 Tax=Nitzschia inconspicua TaxID=303405 RepID=A0A9K3M622_9STRA|nr:hypothetical protein IV203_013722 [Nitzschia inconspicua]